MVDYVKRLSRADVREEASRRQGACGRHRPGRCRLAEDLREARRRRKAQRRSVGRRRGGHSPEDGAGDDGDEKGCSRRIATRSPTGKLVTRETAKQRARRQRRRLRDPDVPQPDRARLQRRPGEDRRRQLRRAGRVGRRRTRRSSATTASRAACRASAFVAGWVYASGRRRRQAR